ncbi:MAG TPA: proton-conducting transporter membrane subunit [Anaerolineaceae bacterium]|nr:proton-conducting transporter membrane subunit [Anaerolineaceae bacterium]
MDTAFVWLIAIPLAASPVNYLAGRLGPAGRVERATSPVRWVALLALLAAWIPFGLAAQYLAAHGPAVYTYGAISLRLDGLSLVLSGVALALGTLVMLFSGQYIAGEDGENKYYALLTAMIGAIIGLSCATDLFNLWVWFETMAISSYMLVAFYHKQAGALEAGIKYLVQSTVGSVFVLLGIGLVFGTSGTLDLSAHLQKTAQLAPALLAAGALFVIGFGVKTALVPMHTWLPDAHSQAPSGISAMLSGVVIEAGLVAMLRALAPLANLTSLWGPILLGFSAVNMLFGNLMALRQTQVKRMLAYSSLSHIGYMLLGIGITVTFHQVEGAQGGLFHLINHGIMKGLAFLAAGALLYALHIAHGDHSPLTVGDLSGASRRYPLVAIAFSVAVLGLGGLPPLAGFMSKWQIFVAGFQTQVPWVQALVIFAALNSVLSLAYYAPLVNAIYRREMSSTVKQGLAIPATMNIPLVLMALAVIVLGIWPDLVSWLTGPGAKAILAAFGG